MKKSISLLVVLASVFNLSQAFDGNNLPEDILNLLRTSLSQTDNSDPMTALSDVTGSMTLEDGTVHPVLLTVGSVISIQQATSFLNVKASEPPKWEWAVKVLEEYSPMLPDAMSNYAHILIHGTPTIRDVKRGMSLMHKAAAQNHPKAVANLGHEYLVGNKTTPKDPEKAVELFRTAIALEDVSALGYLGYHLTRQDGFAPEEFAEGIDLLKQAAEKGDYISNYNLACIYFERGNAAERAQIIPLLKKAAEKDHVEAQFALGHYLLNRNTIENDVNEGLKWLCVAASNGHETAKAVYDAIIAKGTDQADKLKKRRAAQKAARNNGTSSPSHTQQKKSHSNEKIADIIRLHLKARKEEADKKADEAMKRYADLQKKRAAYVEKRQKEDASEDYNNMLTREAVTGPSSTAEAHANAKEQLEARELKGKTRSERSKGKKYVEPDTSYVELKSDTDDEQCQKTVLINSAAHQIFEKLWVLKTNNETGDNTQYTNDRIQLTRKEIRTLVEELGGVYSYKRGKGSHQFAELDNLLDKDAMHLDGEELVFEGLNPTAERGGITLPQNEKNLLKPCYISQLRDLLTSLGYTQNTVRRMDADMEKYFTTKKTDKKNKKKKNKKKK